MAKQISKVIDKKIKVEETTSHYSLKSIIVLIICVLVVFFGFYLFTLRMTKKNDTSTTEKTEEEISISYDTIVLGQSLSMGDEAYYVLFYDFSDDTSSVYQNLFTNYQSKKELPIYRVDMSSGFNKNYLTDGEANYNPSSIAEFSIKGATLMKIDNHEVVDYIEGEGNITNLLR